MAGMINATRSWVGSWLPNEEQFYLDLVYVPELRPTSAAEQIEVAGPGAFDIFDGYAWTRWSAQNWWIPFSLVAGYFTVIPLIVLYMSSREKLRLTSLVTCWNFLFSAFSFLGAAVTIPHLLFSKNSGLVNHGFYAAVCSPPVNYGSGYNGIFVALFIYSKAFELIDTVFLALRKTPLTFLHVWHHSTVLLYCWHSYSVRISTGLWFAAMNYLVHSLMYGYFGCTQLSDAHRKMVRPYAMFITIMQLSQMVVGIVVTVASISFWSAGKECYVNNTNSALGLTMYTSYFILFLELFLRHYVFGGKRGAGAASKKKKAQ
jgi:hypothetical protein